jgi:hypothetical protein
MLSQLTVDDEFSTAVEPLTKDQLAAKIQEGLNSIQRGETFTTEEVVALLNHHGRKSRRLGKKRHFPSPQRQPLLSLIEM